ncbi:hypothetical protein [Kitasatospora sp. NPDC059327]|uniref:hypothetical protein n=1 Tax=Kitasatospora sp. NPDC059327 TaxID=3346803 RepID=UPI003698C9C0
MHPEWWTEHNWCPVPLWLRIPQQERVIDKDDPIGRQVEAQLTSIGPSWQVGHTLYTLVDHDAATGTRALYAPRSFGSLYRLLEDVHPEHLYGAWLLLTPRRRPTNRSASSSSSTFSRRATPRRRPWGTWTPSSGAATSRPVTATHGATSRALPPPARARTAMCRTLCA